MVQTSTSKLIAPPLYHIKGKSVMKACWTDMPCNCWGEHCIVMKLHCNNISTVAFIYDSIHIACGASTADS